MLFARWSRRGAFGIVWLLACAAGCSSSESSNAATDGGLSSAGASTGGSGESGGASGSGASGGAHTGGSNAAGGGNAGGVTSSGGVSQGGAAGVGGSSGTGQGGTDTTARPCTNPTPIHVSNGPQTSPGDTGYDLCGNSWVARRRVAMACPLGPTTTNLNQCMPSYCKSDADCTREPHGYCSEVRHLAGYCGCFYGCMQDSDCAAGEACFCGTPVGHCVPSTCKDDSSCRAGDLCASYLAPCVPGTSPDGACTGAVNGCFSGFACQNPSDECLYDADCPATNPRCELQGDHRVCAPACPGPPPPTP